MLRNKDLWIILIPQKMKVLHMIELITIYTVIFGIAILTNQLFLGSLFTGLYFEVLQPYTYLFRSVENMANIIVLFLSVKINHHYYHRICGSCHKGIKICCINDTEKSLIKMKTNYLSIKEEVTDNLG